jgi:hypothetical protein
MGRFETEWLATDANLEALTDLSGVWIDRVHARKPPDGIILDMDSSESPTHGEQEGSAYNGHFGCTCYHPLFVFNHFGDLERCLLRAGHVHSAEDWRLVLEPVIARYRERGVDWRRPRCSLGALTPPFHAAMTCSEGTAARGRAHRRGPRQGRGGATTDWLHLVAGGNPPVVGQVSRW